MDVMRVSVRLIALAVVTLLPAAATAQPLGTFTWQQQPYCNRLTFTITFTGQVFTLDGFDDGCGAAERLPASGVAAINPNGSASLGISIVSSGGAAHIDATINPATLSGTWSNDFADGGSFVFNGTAPGDPRGSPLGAQWATAYFVKTTGGGRFVGLRHNGMVGAPTAAQQGDYLVQFEGGGHTGQAFNWPTAAISLVAAENWTPTAQGTRMLFSTAPIGGDFATTRMRIEANGFVGIGEQRPDDLLDVRGDIRIGSGGTSGCVKNRNGGTIVGTCASDERFKRDVRAYPDVLDRVASLRPVEFSWRADAFPGRGFGPDREAGLLAQEVEQVLPELVITDADGFKAVNYSQLPLLAIQAIRELKERNDGLEARVAELAARLTALEATNRR